MKDKKKGAIPSGNVENSGEFTHNPIHPAPEGSGLPEEDKEIAGVRVCACVGVKYPFTEEGKPACLSRACPKNNNCKICCKDWRKE